MNRDGIRDEDLLERLRAGDGQALEEIYGRYKTRLFGYCVRLLHDRSDAEDAVHDTFLMLSRGAGSLPAAGAFRTWLFRVARNEALMTIRLKRGHTNVAPDELWDDTTPQQILEGRDRTEVLRQVLDQLKIEYRDALVLREYEGLSYAEIALVTDSTLDSVKSRIFKARKAMHQKLEHLLGKRSQL